MALFTRSERALLATLSLAGMTTALYQTVVTPFMAFFVVDSGVCDNLVDPGYYASYLTSAGHVGRVLTSFFWGRYSDRHGRAVVVEVALASLVVSSLVMSWTLNFWLTVLARFAAGCFDSTWSMVKMLAAERLPVDRQAAAMSSLGASYGMAMLLGPSIGGVLARPAVEYPWLQIPPDSLLARRPYLMPHLAVAVMTSVALFAAHFVLRRGIHASPYSKETQATPDRGGYGAVATDDQPSTNKPGYCMAFCCRRKPALATALYTILSCCEYTEDVVMPLWASAPRTVGGLALDSSQIGFLLAVSGATIIPGQLFLYPAVDERLTTLGVVRLGLVVTAPLAALMPAAALGDSTTWMWTCLAITKVFRLFVAEFVFSAQGIVSNNAVRVEDRGAYLGTQAVICALGRILGPLLCAPFFAWTLAAPPPINYSITFIIIALQLVAAGVVAYAMPPSINFPVEDEQQSAANAAPPPRRPRSSSFQSVTKLKRSRSPQPLVFFDESEHPPDYS